MSMTAGMKIALGAAGVGLVGGVVAERLTSGQSIERNRNAEVWSRLHDEFLSRHPKPDGVSMYVGTEPAWKNAALVGGAALGVAALGGGAMFAAKRMKSYPLFVAGLATTLLGGAAAAGAGASWAVR